MIADRVGEPILERLAVKSHRRILKNLSRPVRVETRSYAASYVSLYAYKAAACTACTSNLGSKTLRQHKTGCGAAFFEIIHLALRESFRSATAKTS